MDILFIFLLPLISPFICIKVFELSGKETFESFINYYLLWLYFFAFGSISPYIITLIYLIFSILLLTILSYENCKIRVINLKDYKLYLGLFGSLFLISIIFNYDGLQWVSASMLLLQCMCFVIERILNYKSSYHDNKES